MKINKIINQDRIDLALVFDKLGCKRGAEIGVREGKFSEILCTYVKSLEKLYLVDPWNRVFEDYISRNIGNRKQKEFYQNAKKRLAKYPVCEFIIKTSTEAVRDIEPYSLDFVYIDGSHSYDYVITDIIEWTRRVKEGGIIAGDDYLHLRHGNVIQAVDNYIEAHHIETLNIMIPKKESTEHNPQWWFVKPGPLYRW